ncbi:MAG: lipopolysaccharide biosynthesis protein, partial [Bacteroidaceae bacterium]|nr:lipopolysaccharide biosynthesis protein [Bacteroidaceae bacterium]
MSIASKNKRLAINTMLLYFRMLLIMAVSFFSTRIVFNTLGEVEYGIYITVGSLAATFGIITGSLTAAVSRYLNIELGKGDSNNLSKIFSTSILIHVTLAIIILILAELLAPWFIENKLTIPADRINAAVGVFHCSIITFVINLISIPYTACIISHENMKIYAYISFIEAILTLIFVYLLSIAPYDKLVTYAFLMMLVVIIKLVCYQQYCHHHYIESHFHYVIDKKLIKEMFGFASWNMIGSSSVILSDQGVNILLNILCNNPIVNAARGLAMQVNQAVNSFAQNFMTALNPQITKSYGAGDFDSYKKTMINGGRFSMSLLTLLALPILVETDYILHLWLGEVPDYAVYFVRLILL